MGVWEAVTAIATATTAIVIAGTVLVAYRQLEHLRRATQLEGTLKIFEELNQTEMRDSRRFVFNELPERMSDPRFSAEISVAGTLDESRHPELYIMRAFEKIGTYVRYKLIDGEVVCDYAGPWILETWETLRDLGIIEQGRRTMGRELWENYELLYDMVCDFNNRKNVQYPQTAAERRAKARQIAHDNAAMSDRALR